MDTFDMPHESTMFAEPLLAMLTPKRQNFFMNTFDSMLLKFVLPAKFFLTLVTCERTESLMHFLDMTYKICSFRKILVTLPAVIRTVIFMDTSYMTLEMIFLGKSLCTMFTG